MNMLRPVRDVAEEENFRLEDRGSGTGVQIAAIRRDPVEPEPVGTYVVLCFQITGYDQDCDGSLMARLSHVDEDDNATGWTETNIGLYPETALVVESPQKLWGKTNESQKFEEYKTAREDLASIIAQETCGIKGALPETQDYELADEFIKKINDD